MAKAVRCITHRCLNTIRTLIINRQTRRNLRKFGSRAVSDRIWYDDAFTGWNLETLLSFPEIREFPSLPLFSFLFSEEGCELVLGEPTLTFESTLISRAVNATKTAMKLATKPDSMLAQFAFMTHEDELATASAASLSVPPALSLSL